MKEKLSFNRYQQEANELISEEGKKDLLTNGVLGLAGESGECCDIIKKYKYQGHQLNKDDLIEELGDVLWYIAETCLGLDVTLEEVAIKNLDKLHARYHGSKFHATDSINRKK